MLNLDKIEDIIAGIEIGFVLTHHSNLLNGRPLATLSLDEEGALYFMVKRGSDIATEILTDPEVHITYSDSVSGNYLLITGQATLICDEKKQKQLWSPELKKWFHDGYHKGEYQLLRVRIETASFWDEQAGGMLYLEEDNKIIPMNTKAHDEQNLNHSVLNSVHQNERYEKRIGK